MAVLSKSGTPSLATVTPCAAHQLSNLVAGEAIAAGDACYVKSDGLVWRSNGTAATAPAKVDGFAPKAYVVGEAVTLFFDVNFAYGSGLTPGARYYAAATAGQLDTAATTGGTAPVAFAVDATRIHVFQSRY